MSDGFMADPIRPGDMGSSNIKSGNYNANQKSSSAIKIVVVIILLMFVLPFIFAIMVFYKIWDEAGSDIISQIKESTMVPTGYYELSDDEQMAVSRIFGTGILYEKGGPKTIAQSDCRHLKNVITGYGNASGTSVGWYDNGYCEAGNVGISAYYLDEEEKNLGGVIARIDIQSAADNALSCINVTFAYNFRYVASANKSIRCNTNKVEIKPDGINVPELKPLNGSDSSDDETNPSGDQNILKS